MKWGVDTKGEEEKSIVSCRDSFLFIYIFLSRFFNFSSVGFEERQQIV